MKDVIIPATYEHIKTGKNYHVYGCIKNKTLDTIMVMYKDNFHSYVRESEDFLNKFKFIQE